MAAEGIEILRDLAEAQAALMRAVSVLAETVRRIDERQEEIITRLQSLEAMLAEIASDP